MEDYTDYDYANMYLYILATSLNPDQLGQNEIDNIEETESYEN